MSYKMHPKQLESVFGLSSEDRYSHFLSKVCDWGELWALEDPSQQFLIINPEPDLKYIPVWPHSEYAAAYGKEYEIYKPFKIELSRFMENWLPGLDADGVKVGVLPNLDTTVWIMEPMDLKADLENGIAEYE